MSTPTLKTSTRQAATVPEGFAGQRLDKALAELFPDFSRTVLQRWLADGQISVDGAQPRQRDRLKGGESIEIEIPPPAPTQWQAQAIALDLIYHDDEILVLNKPPGLVVHPGAGNPAGTLLNALLHFDASLAGLPRAGIVHRLDKDTSGLLVVARTERARRDLIDQLKERTLRREYLAIVVGVMISGTTIDRPIGRDSRDRRRMTITSRGKVAISHLRVSERFRAHSLVSVRLETGRTHQIRVHLADHGFPVLGDPVYGRRLKIPPDSDALFQDRLREFRRQALHAAGLRLRHPGHGEDLSFESPLPQDMQSLLEQLRLDQQKSAAPK